MKKIGFLLMTIAFFAACAVYLPENDAFTGHEGAGDYAMPYSDGDNLVPGDEDSCPQEAFRPEPIFFPPGELTLENLLIIANQRRQIVHEPDMERIYSWLDAREPITLNGAELFGGQYRNELSREEAEDDAWVLFTLLRHIYAGYHYFGGDDIFLPLLHDLLQEIAGQERWPTPSFVELVKKRLGEVIVDNHFVIDGYSGDGAFNDPHHTFIWDTPFDRSERGLFRRETGLYVTGVRGYEIDQLFRLTMSEAGDVYYAPIVMRSVQEGDRYSLYITFEHGVQRVDLTPTLYERTHPRGASSSLRYQNEIPILDIRWMANSFNYYTHGYHTAQSLLAHADSLRDAPVFILDLRSNEGGAAAFSYTWLYRLLGEYVPSNFNWLSIFDTDFEIPAGLSRPISWYRGFTDRAGLDFAYPPELSERYLQREQIADNIFFTPPEAQDRVVANDQLIIVLIDRFTRSAGEIFADQFTNIENTLIIGQNTSGSLLTSYNRALYLPGSGVPVIMGRHMLVHPKGTWREGVGLAPDIWVTGDALTAALALLDVPL
ncbi:MAG: S41 family peptidase [Oscillospiraceae bacterium]|nr:S41 family peptidase [Oscillospiraceae bacterium]